MCPPMLSEHQLINFNTFIYLSLINYLFDYLLS